MTRLQTGAKITTFPGTTWNSLVDLLDRFEALQAEVFALMSSQQTNPVSRGLEIYVKNMTGEALVEKAVAGLDIPFFTPPDYGTEGLLNDAVDELPHFEVVKPVAGTHEGRIAFTQEPIASEEIGKAWLPGAIWTRVDVKSSEDKTAGMKAGETMFLESGTGNYPILWKPEGTGKKWCVVQTVGASGGGSFPWRRAKIVGRIEGAQWDSDNQAFVGQVTDAGVAVLMDEVGTGTIPVLESGGEPAMKAFTLDRYSAIEGTADVPIIAWGKVTTYSDDFGDPVEAFQVVSTFDITSLEGHATGAVQGPYHSAGENGYAVGGGSCTPIVPTA